MRNLFGYTFVALILLSGEAFSRMGGGEQQEILNRHFKKYVTFNLDPTTLQRRMQTDIPASFKNEVGSITLDINKEYTWKLRLRENDLRGHGYRAYMVRKGQLLPDTSVRTVKTYRGSIEGIPSGKVRLTIDKDHLSGYIDDGSGIYFIEPLRDHLKDASRESFILYESADVVSSSYSCMSNHVSAAEKTYPPETFKDEEEDPLLSGDFCYWIEVMTLADHFYFGEFQEATNARIMSVFNQIEGLFIRDFNLRFKIVHQVVYTDEASLPVDYGSLPATDVDAWDIRPLYVDYIPTSDLHDIDRDLAYVFTRYPSLGSSGQAGANICTSDNSVGLTKTSSTFRKELLITAHEVGHMIGGTHIDEHPDTEEWGVDSCKSNRWSRPLMCSICNDKARLRFNEFNRNRIRNTLEENIHCMVEGHNLAVWFDFPKQNEGWDHVKVADLISVEVNTGLYGNIPYRVTNYGTTVFRAGESIQLKPGFVVEAGGYFSAAMDTIDNCRRFQLPVDPPPPTPKIGQEDTAGFSNLSMQVYPNPFTAAINITLGLPEANEISLKLMDVRGKIVYEWLSEEWLDAGSHRFYWNTGELPAAMYFYTLETPDKKITGKLVKIYD